MQKVDDDSRDVAGGGMPNMGGMGGGMGGGRGGGQRWVGGGVSAILDQLA